MEITGDKVILRAMEEQDREMLLNLIQNPETKKVTKGYARSLSREHLLDRFRCRPGLGESHHYVIADREQPGIGLGLITLSHLDSGDGSGEIYIKLMGAARGRGYGQDAVTALVAWAFDHLGLTKIYSSILEQNIASRRLFEKCGFRQEGSYKTGGLGDRHDRNVCSYEIQKDRL